MLPDFLPSCQVRHREPGDSIEIDHGRHRKVVAVLRDLKVPAQVRSDDVFVLIVASGSEDHMVDITHCCIWPLP